MENAKISIIVPVYNVVRYLRECIDSIINQTYSNLEIIIVDDGSTDGSGETCDAYEQLDKRIQVVHQKNQGLSSARNTALSLITGDLVGFVDSDDWLEPDYYETLEKHMQKTDADIVISGCYYVYQDSMRKSKIYPQDAPYDRQSGLKALSEHRVKHTVWDKLYRRDLFTGLKFTEGRVHEDVLITYQLILRAEHIECLDYYGYYQRMRAGSIIHRQEGVVENFYSHYELWQNIKAKKVSEEIPEKVVNNFFIETVEYAYATLYRFFIPCQKNKPELFLLTKEFRKKNRKKIASLGRKFWLAVHIPFPFQFEGWLRNEFKKSPKLWNALKRSVSFFKQCGEEKLFE